MLNVFKSSKQLEPYFLVVVKAKMEFQDVGLMAMMDENNSREVVLSALKYEGALNLLITQLEKFGLEKEHQMIIIDDVCQYYYRLLGRKKIMMGTPELLIINESSNN